MIELLENAREGNQMGTRQRKAVQEDSNGSSGEREREATGRKRRS